MGERLRSSETKQDSGFRIRHSELGPSANLARRERVSVFPRETHQARFLGRCRKRPAPKAIAGAEKRAWWSAPIAGHGPFDRFLEVLSCVRSLTKGHRRIAVSADKGRTFPQSLADRLADIDADNCYVFVWPDSIAQSRFLKDVLVDRHFEYRLAPMTEDAKIRFGVPSAKVKVQ